MFDLVFLLAGAVLLYLGAEWLVSGSSSLALSLRVPQLVVGLTVVAYGTSAPELIVSILAAFSGHGDVALEKPGEFGQSLGLQVVGHACRERRHPRTELDPARRIARHEPMLLERAQKPVGD